MTVQIGRLEDDAPMVRSELAPQRAKNEAACGASSVKSSLPRMRFDPFRRTMLMKSSPYIGSFRHSPPSHWRSARNLSRPTVATTFTSRSSRLSPSFAMKTSPYIGYIRHAPPTPFSSRLSKAGCYHCRLSSRCLHRGRSLAKTELAGCIGHLDHCSRCVDKGLQDAAIISGRLPGGRPTSADRNKIGAVDSPLTWPLTPSVLVRLARWLSGGTFLPSTSSPKHPGRHLGNEQQSNGDFAEHTVLLSQGIITVLYFPLFSILLRRVPQFDDGGASNALPPSSSSSVNSSGGEDRLPTPEDEHRHRPHYLDYAITQVDIARMARNAARHLDVESIFTLPTITYRSKESRDSPADQGESRNGGHKDDAAWSWMMVPQDLQGLSTTAESSCHNSVPSQDSTDEQDKCVICLEYFEDGERLRVLPCDHLFHTGCIDKWLSGSFSHQECFTRGCPTCKRQLSSSEPDSPEENRTENEDGKDMDGNEAHSPDDDGELISVPQDGNIPPWSFEVLGDVLASESLNMAPE